MADIEQTQRFPDNFISNFCIPHSALALIQIG